MRVVYVTCAILAGWACSGDASTREEVPEQLPDELPDDEPLFEEPVREAPEALEAPDDWPQHSRRLVAGREHACVIVEGRVACWGRTEQLGGAAGTDPRVISGVENAVELAAGDEHTCALSRDGRVRCWGSATPSPVPNLSGVVQIAAGAAHTCARQTSGAVACWGDGRVGQMGQSGEGLDDVREPIVIPNVDSAISLTAGGRSTCVVMQGGNVSCWGLVGTGEVEGVVGASRVELSRFPIVRGVGDCDPNCWSGEERIDFACAAVNDGTVCWERDGQRRETTSQSGRSTLSGDTRCTIDADGNVGCQRGMLPVSRADEIAFGVAFACARADDEVACWGRSNHGQAGPVPDMSNGRRIPVANVRAFSTSWGVCFVAGRNREGQCVGSGFGLPERSPVLRRVEALDGALALASTSDRLCWISAERTIECRGNRGRDRDPSWTVEGIENVVELDLRSRLGCARVRDGGVWCWGAREALGLDGHGDVEPTLVAEATRQYAFGDRGGCAVTRQQGLTCWGYPNRPAVESLRRVAQVAVGNVHACVRHTSGEVLCWGYNRQGQLGRELAEYAERDFTPGPVDGLGRATAITAFNETTCAIVNREAWCWGEYDEEQRALRRVQHLDGSLAAANSGCTLTRGELTCRGLPDTLADVIAPQAIRIPR